MTKKQPKSSREWHDPDDAPPWTAEQAARAELAQGGRVIRPATGTLTRSFDVHTSAGSEAKSAQTQTVDKPGSVAAPKRKRTVS